MEGGALEADAAGAGWGALAEAGAAGGVAIADDEGAAAGGGCGGGSFPAHADSAPSRRGATENRVREANRNRRGESVMMGALVAQSLCSPSCSSLHRRLIGVGRRTEIVAMATSDRSGRRYGPDCATEPSGRSG